MNRDTATDHWLSPSLFPPPSFSSLPLLPTCEVHMFCSCTLSPQRADKCSPTHSQSCSHTAPLAHTCLSVDCPASLKSSHNPAISEYSRQCSGQSVFLHRPLRSRCGQSQMSSTHSSCQTEIRPIRAMSGSRLCPPPPSAGDVAFQNSIPGAQPAPNKVESSKNTNHKMR